MAVYDDNRRCGPVRGCKQLTQDRRSRIVQIFTVAYRLDNLQQRLYGPLRFGLRQQLLPPVLFQLFCCERLLQDVQKALIGLVPQRCGIGLARPSEVR